MGYQSTQSGNWGLDSFPAADFRVDYLEEARDCLRASNRLLKRYPETWHEIPAFWANLLGAIANSNVAAASENVGLGLVVKDQKRKEEIERVRTLLDEKLGK